jgi:flagellar export protein FliJ
MPFVYRLQKILDFRIRKKEEQLIAVQRAQQEVRQAEENISRNNIEINMIKENQRKFDALMMEAYDKYLHYLWEKAKELENIRQEKLRRLQEEVHKLVEAEKAVKVLEKHKEKHKEIYIEEEKQAELKLLSEIAVQRHFRQTKEKFEESEEGEEEILRELSSEEIEIMEGES